MNEETDFQRIQSEYLKCKQKSLSFWKKREELEKWYKDKITLMSRYYQETNKYVKPEHITSFWEFPLSLSFNFQELKAFFEEKGFDTTIITTKDHYSVCFQF